LGTVEVPKSKERFVCVHGHFYQPPRENPWIDEIEVQDSAKPFHDWNERIAYECYRANAAAHVLDADGRISELVDNYARISFNFGPTLLSWLERREPETYRAILEADRESRRRFGGHGSALAQPYNHMIMPLAVRRDKVTQTLWGLKDFERRFGRRAEGMWLPETAVDLATLEVLAEAGVRYTILAPRQARRLRRFGAKEWTDAGKGIDPTRAYRVWLPSGKTLSVFFYDGPISLGIAFEKLLADGANFARRLVSAFSEEREDAQLVSIATDGESYGHHHRFGEMALAYALKTIEEKGLAKLTNFSQFLALHPPTWEVELHENSSWSCVHGVERWRSDCGCNCGAGPGWRQAWRGPLRAAFDALRDEAGARYEERAAALLRDPWAARDAYVEIVLDPSPRSIDSFLLRHALKPLSGDERVEVLKLLELQLHLLLMYTSCGWFFDDLSGLETVQVLQYAARAADLAGELFGGDWHEKLASRLEKAESNLAEHGSGRRVYERLARSAAVGFEGLCAQYALDALFAEPPKHAQVYSADVERDAFRRAQAGRARLALGRVRLVSRFTLEEKRYLFAAMHLGDHAFHGGVQEDRGDEDYKALEKDLVERFDRADMTGCMMVLGRRFGDSGYDLSRLFADEQRRMVGRVLENALLEAVVSHRQVYEHHAPLLRFLRARGMPPPKAIQTAAEVALHHNLRRALERTEPDLPRAAALLEECERAGVRVEPGPLPALLRTLIERRVRAVVERSEDDEALARLLESLRLLKRLPFSVDLWKAQNLLFSLLHGTAAAARARAAEAFRGLRDAGRTPADPWRARFVEAAELLGVRLEPLPLPAAAKAGESVSA
jgi:alpha-amylase/alpha-mannosidase (GH57 family)